MNFDSITAFSIECQNGDEVFEIPPMGIATMLAFGGTIYFETLVRYGNLEPMYFDKGMSINRLRAFSDN